MEYTSDMELNILSCLLEEPKLMKQLIIEEKHFIKYHRMFKFMKMFYEKYKCFDIPLMYSVCKEKKDLMEYIEIVLGIYSFTSHFNQYQERLIELYNESQKEKWIIKKIYLLNEELFFKKINTIKYKEKLEEIYSNAEKIYKDAK